MSWYYVESGAQKGPVDETQFAELVRTGTIRVDTLVWREGMKDWATYGVVSGAGPSPKPGAAPVALEPGHVLCGECGRSVPATDTVELGGRVICANCKPVVAQRMIEGTSTGTAELDPEEMIADLRSRGGYDIDIGSVVSRAFDVVKNNLWPCIGVTLLIMIILGASGQVPCIGFIISMLATGPLVGGLLHYFILQVRDQPATLNDAFVGLKMPLVKDLMLSSLITQGVYLAFVMLALLPVFMGVMAFDPEQMENGVPPWFFGYLPLVFIPIFYVYLIWYPAFLIIADTGLGFWKAMELSRRLVHQRFFTWIGVYIVMFLLALAGVLALCVGIFFVMPMTNAMFAIIWNDIRKQADDVRLSRVGQQV